MKIKLLIITLTSILLFSSCVKTPEPEEESPVRFSILGDSYSTFEGYVSPETNDVWVYYENIGLNSVSQTWWWQVMEKTGWTLEKNNSFSGSLVCNMDFGNYYGAHSFLRRMNDLGNPDVILVFGGTNDVWDEAPIGEYVYADWTESELCTFRPAMACLLDGLKTQYPKAKVYFLLDLDLDEAFIASVHRICRHFDVDCIDLYDITKEWDHPNVTGMREIAAQVIEALALDDGV